METLYLFIHYQCDLQSGINVQCLDNNFIEIPLFLLLQVFAYVNTSEGLHW